MGRLGRSLVEWEHVRGSGYMIVTIFIKFVISIRLFLNRHHRSSGI